MLKKNEYLLISRIGPNSVHNHWLTSDITRIYDVFLSSYEEHSSIPELDGVFFERRPGTKVAGYFSLLIEHREFLKDYKHVALFDDDIIVSSRCLNEMFLICSEYNLKIAQPALTCNSHFTYGALLEQKALQLRYVNFIEMMCPVFRSDVLGQITFLYSLGFESGIDLVWCNLAYENPHDFAVIDKTPVLHSEPVGKKKAANGFVDGRRYEDHIFGILEHFSLDWLPCVPYAAIDKKGNETTSRIMFILYSLSILRAIPKQSPVLKRIRSILVHIKHLMFSSACNKRPVKRHEYNC